MFQTLKNMFIVPDLRTRVLFTVLILFIYRLGAHIPCPFINVEKLREGLSGMMGTMFGMADMFTGGAFSNMTVMALGIMPYITASIILQLLMVVWPKLEKISKEGEAGRKKITQWTRYGTVGLAFVQGFGIGMFILSQPDWITPFMRDLRPLFLLTTMVSIAAGTTFLMWLGEKITEKGIGNGISLLIAVGIMVHYIPYARISWINVSLGDTRPIWLFVVAGLCLFTTVVIILIQEGARKIPIQHAKQAAGGRRLQMSQTNYLPLKVNTAGVMPVIFSMAILTLPTTIFGWVGASGGELGFIGEFFARQSRYNLYELFGLEKGSIFLLLQAFNAYTFLYIILTGGFCFFYTAIVFNPADVADNLRRVGAFVPGYRPGKQTADYIDKVMTRITTVGALFLVSVSILPQILMESFRIPFEMAEFAGGTGLIIVVAVVLDTMKQVESRLLMRHYDGFKSRRQQGGGGSRKWAEKRLQ